MDNDIERKISYRHTYGSGSAAAPFIAMAIWTTVVMVLFIVLFSVVNNTMPSSSDSTIKTVLAVAKIAFPIFVGVIALVFLLVGISKTKGASKAKEIEKEGVPQIGIIIDARKDGVSYNGLRLGTNKISFVYTPDGKTFGMTTQLVGGRFYKMILALGDDEVPIKVKGKKAVLDQKEIKKMYRGR